MIIVADAGPLIHLSKIGHLHLLQELYGRIIVPAAVYEEVVVRGAGLPGSRELAGATWVEIIEHDVTLPLWRLLRDDLDAGESAALSIASARHADLVLVDDRAARIAARRLGLGVKGTLGVLIDAKAQGRIHAVSPLLRALVTSGMWMTEAVVRAVCAQAGEEPPDLDG